VAREDEKESGLTMTGAREQILGDIRKSLRGGATLSPQQTAQLEARVANHPAGLIPRRSSGRDPAGLATLFAEQAEMVGTTVVRLKSLAEVPAALAEYLSLRNLPAEMAAAPDPLVDNIPWAARPLLKLKRGKPGPKDQVGLSVAFSGIAETGTLMMTSGPDNPSTLNFLPDTHAVILPASRLVGPMEDGWRRLRGARGNLAAGAIPRTVNFITGPSSTGDIEQKIEKGAHGPRQQLIMIIEDEAVA
jgi:L-lactate dehydrogenase complex protein LldG